MQQSFEINAGQSIPQVLVAELSKFGQRRVKVIIEDVLPETVADQRELGKNVLALRERFRHVKVDPDLNLSALANQMLGE